ncbi:MAG: hypothetical protein ACI4NU_06750 [Christensenellales bacterium]
MKTFLQKIPAAVFPAGIAYFGRDACSARSARGSSERPITFALL